MNDTTICEAAKQVTFHLFGAAYTSEQLETITAFVRYLYEDGFTAFRQLINKAIIAIKNGDHVLYLYRGLESDKSMVFGIIPITTRSEVLIPAVPTFLLGWLIWQRLIW